MSDPFVDTSHTRLDRLQDQFYVDPLLGSVGQHVKIHKTTPGVGNERGDIQIKVYVVLSHGQDNFLPPHPLILGFMMTQ